MIDLILGLCSALGKFIVKIWRRVVSFVQNIVGFFKDPHRLELLKRDKNLIATTIRQKLDTGDYKVVSCLFDKETNSVIATEEGDIQEVESEFLDEQTRREFGNKDLLVLK